MRRLFLTVLLILTLCYTINPSFSLATTYYVSSSLGNDSNNGASQLEPWKTISKVNSEMANFNAGDSILFQRGETWTLDRTGGETNSLEITCSGDSSKHITFGAYGTGSLPLFDGNNANGHLGIIHLTGASYVTIEYLDIYQAFKNGIGIGGAEGDLNCHHITIQNCTVRTNYTQGFMGIYARNQGSQGSTNNITVQNNTVYDIKWNGIRITGGVTNSTIRNNAFYDNGHHGIDGYNENIQNNNITIFDNEIFRNDGGIYLTGFENSHVQNNIIKNNRVYGLKIEPTPNGIVPRNNIVKYNIISENNGHALWFTRNVNLRVYNNTIYKNDILLLDEMNTSFDYRNNLSYMNSQDNDEFDPLFVNAEEGDFHLHPESPAIDAGNNSVWSGTPNVTDFEGNPITDDEGIITAFGGVVDIGAYEYQAVDVNQPPVARLTADSVSGDAPLTVNLDASSSEDPDGTIESYEWDFGDGTMASGVSVSHTYTDGCNYAVTLRVTDNEGAADTASETITVWANILRNGDFSEGKQPWNFYTNGSGNYSVVEGEAMVAIIRQGSNVQLHQKRLALEGNILYRLTFRARHSTGRDLTVVLIKHTSPYTNYGLNQTIDLTETMQTYSVEFMTRRGAKTDGRLMFSMSSYDQDGTTYYIDDVAIEKVTDCQLSICGDGIVGPGEECDDGNSTSGDGCDASCKLEPFCGDENVDPGEECDEGDDNSDDPGALCRTDCTLAGCGDGIVDPGQECDDGANNSDAPDAFCRTDCTLAGCGDGVLDTGEECDDGNTTPGDGCDATCKLEPVCGDGIVGPGEECDEGANNSDAPDAFCRTDCTLAGCGDGVLDTGEECDDGNTTPGDGCDATCKLEPVCGDGIVGPGEECDEGANNSDAPDAFCRTDCTLAGCGDGIVDSGEQCDDGNTTPGDGCDVSCELEPVCGDGNVDPGEECDEGDDNSDDPGALCRTDCTLAGCGDGIVDPGEECDDGNLIDDDTCSNACLLNEQCPNVVTNGDFSGGKPPWTFYTNGSGNFSVVEGEARVAIIRQGSNVQLHQKRLALEGNILYRLTFRARHSTGRDLTVALIKHTSPYTNYGLNQTIDLTETMQTFSVEFMTRRGAKTDGRLMFSMSSYDQDGTTYYIDDVAIEKVADCQ